MASTVKMRGGDAHPILQRSGLLAISVVTDYGADFAQTGTNKVYAAMHQFGGVTSPNSMIPGKLIPARPFFGLGDDAQEEILYIVGGYLGGAEADYRRGPPLRFLMRFSKVWLSTLMTCSREKSCRLTKANKASWLSVSVCTCKLRMSLMMYKLTTSGWSASSWAMASSPWGETFTSRKADTVLPSFSGFITAVNCSM